MSGLSYVRRVLIHLGFRLSIWSLEELQLQRCELPHEIEALFLASKNVRQIFKTPLGLKDDVVGLASVMFVFFFHSF